MRSSLLVSILIAVTASACNQSLTGTMTGTGGAGTGTGGFGTGGVGATGGGPFGTGGTGATACSTLAAEYQSALSAAETCQVGASGQCQQLARGSLSGCSCPTHVTDTGALDAIGQAWSAASCNVGTQPPCAILCPAALNSSCVSVDGGSLGFCSYVPGTGGTSGAGGDGATGGTTGAGGSTADAGLASCAQLASQYAAVLEGAKSCTGGAAGQCAASVPAALSACPACTEFVNDGSVLNVIQQEWLGRGCGNVAVPCPRIACPAMVSGICLPSDAGGSVCAQVPVTTFGG